MYELIAKLVYDEMNNYRCIKKEYSGTVGERKVSNEEHNSK